MEDEKLYDISEVCKYLGTTSRALRFYEEKGLIESTLTSFSSRRRYTEKQLADIKNIITLRSLGLSVKSISDLKNQNSDLKDIICSKRAEIYASIDTKIHEINLLNEVLFAIDSGKNDISEIIQTRPNEIKEYSAIVKECSEAIINGKTDLLYNHLSERLKNYMPENVYEKIRKDTFFPLGTFISLDKTSADEKYPHKFYQFVKYSTLGLKITYVIYNEKIEGLWLGYYDMKGK